MEMLQCLLFLLLLLCLFYTTWHKFKAFILLSLHVKECSVLPTSFTFSGPLLISFHGFASDTSLNCYVLGAVKNCMHKIWGIFRLSLNERCNSSGRTWDSSSSYILSYTIWSESQPIHANGSADSRLCI